LQVLAGLVPVAFVIATSAVVSRVPGAVGHGLHSAEWRALRDALLVTGGLFVLEQLVSPFQFTIAEALAWRVDDALRERILHASFLPVGTSLLEEQQSLDDLTDVVDPTRGAGFTAGSACAGLLALIARYVRWATSAVLVGVVYAWWAAAALALAALAVRVGIRSGLGRLAAYERSFAPQRRRRNYLARLLTHPSAAKEVRIFGLVPWLQARFRTAALDAVVPVWKVRRRTVVRPYVLSVPLSLVLSGLVTVAVARAAAHGDLTLGRLAFVLQAMLLIGTLGQFFNECDFQTELGMSSYEALRRFETAAEQQAYAPAATPADVSGAPRDAIRFEDVRFAYPGSARRVLDGLDLTIPAGRSLAVVGLNGAGKTTLVKLLARLVEPDAGRIAVDGIDLRDVDPEAWRARLGAIFQDFLHYELSVLDNVGFGAPRLVGDRERIGAVVERVGADEFVQTLPRRYETTLARSYEDGADLSGGQWQRLAIARALMAVEDGAGVLVLDEPTANLDVRAEAAFYERFLDLTAGLTTILISHRFSTVRRADRIVVLADGRVAEEGTHDELVAAGGRYAEMFRVQAERFGAA
ncbi:MAG TPA: ABC transporter ATP-binding protein, partial [Gaiellaceae bacterium]|nr:ABC transporter ATP-binding protein [Gaiellaceae bacterium]